MIKNDEPVKFCRFCVDGHTYSGKIRNNTVDIVEGDPYNGFSSVRISYPVDRVKFLTPVTPKKIWAVGRNYRDHVAEMNSPLPEEPLIFMKAVTALAGPGDFIRIPAWAGNIDYEGELAVVIAKNAKNVSEDDALKYVLGYTIINDVTARDLQKKDRQWIRAKGFDTFAPLGPALLLTNEMPEETRVRTLLNGKVVQDAPISDMIFPVARIISHISRFATLERGDVIATGTPSGVGHMKVGDVVDVEVDGIGRLRSICAM